MNLVFVFRYISILFTSIFYLLGPQSPFYFKVGVVVSICVAAWIITDIQRKYIENKTILKSTVLAEIIGLTLLLIPTGGISSPFIWYALNPVLVAASFLTTLFCWGALSFYLGSTTLITYYLFDIDHIVIILQEKSNFYLVCLLTTMLVRLYSGLTKELYSKKSLLKDQQEELVNVNNTLSDTNQKYHQTLEHVMSLYHLMENFNSKKSIKKLVKEITLALMKCTQSDEVFFWLTDLNQQNSYIENMTNNHTLEKDLIENWNNIRMKRRPFTSKIKNEPYLMKVIRNANNVGVIGVKVSSGNDEKNTFLLNRPFDYLAELSEIMLEKIHMDQMMDQMIIIEEQNRIANEIHDSVSQRLFGIVYALHSLQIKGQSMKREELNQEYRFLSQSANTTMKELRSAIYRLSSVKKGEKPFLIHIKKYLDEYARLNDIRIYYQFFGDEAFVSKSIKQALYRIICEACGNAVRHGECHGIELKLSLLGEKSVLVIQDDGKGINLTMDANKREKGIGLLNMRNIVSSFTGTISINGIMGEGTEIHIEIPNISVSESQEVSG
ncbi:ATP-binding protein [Neobacillus niacini]|uniref:sensor histidine kinase n=1 Tax=Neobacillus niacini TaxID=86668 RepID=UPI002FFF9347